MLSNNNLSFTTNNGKVTQSSKKRLKLIQCFKYKTKPTRLLFLQETHSDRKFEQKWIKAIKVLFFSHTNFCGFLTSYFEQKQLQIKTSKQIIIDVSINDSEYILINLYNANTEKDQINVLNNLYELLEEFDTYPKSS